MRSARIIARRAPRLLCEPVQAASVAAAPAAGGRRPLQRLTGLLCGMAAFGCTGIQPYQPFDSAAHLRGRYAERVGHEAASRIEVPFELDEAVRRELEGRVSLSGSETRRLEQILSFVFDHLGLQYSLTPTLDAGGTFRTRRGNCLSFVNLFVGIARERRLAPFYVEVENYQRWTVRDGVVVSHGHIVAGMHIDGELSTFDFLPYPSRSYRKFRPIDDLRAAAHYYNNLGAEALLAGDLRRAHRLLTIAVDLSPGFEKASNNLGVALLRLGRAEEAIEIYTRGLELHPKDTAILSNLARALQQLGRMDEALELLDRLEAVRYANPFFFVYRGELALGQGDTETALDYMIRALRQDHRLPEVHVGLTKVYLAIGDLERARFHIERALKLDATHDEARRYAAMLYGRAVEGR